jgi:hypothetical protein
MSAAPQTTTSRSASAGPDAIKNHMINQGVAPSRLAVVSYGEEKPLDPGSNERAWAQNRRAEFIITWGDAATVGSSTDNK